jgi:hypothetical protein
LRGQVVLVSGPFWLRVTHRRALTMEFSPAPVLDFVSFTVPLTLTWHVVFWPVGTAVTISIDVGLGSLLVIDMDHGTG